MSKLILNNEQRTMVRAFLRSLSGFDAWRAANGSFASRDFTSELMEKAIAELNVADHVAQLLATPHVIRRDPESEARAAVNAVEDARVETWIAGQAASGMASGKLGDGNSFAVITGSHDVASLTQEMEDTVLDQLRPWLSPSLLGSVETALAPIVAAALKPAVETIVEKTVTLDATGKPVIAPVTANRVGSTTLGKLFSISGRMKHSDKHVSQWDCATAPAVDPFYVPDVLFLAKLISAIDPALPRKPRNVWLAGPAGTGKSTTPEQVAARAKRPFVCIGFNRATEPADLIGGNGLVISTGADGKSHAITQWVDGMLTKAVRTPGCIIMLDEITFAPPGLLATLQSLLASRYMHLPTGEIVHCAEGVTFVCCDNTKGFGDETGVYAGTNPANGALVDRMARMIVVDYLAPDLEAQALTNHTGASRAACDRLVAWVNGARKLAGFDAYPLSLRRQIAFVEMTLDGFTPIEVAEATMLSRLPDAERETLRAFWKTSFDHAAFQAELDGASVPAAPSKDPVQAASREVFDMIDPA